MKKYILLFLFLLLIPIKIKAQTYNAKDLSISLDDDLWYVFTRDNIKNNSNLEKTNLSYELLNNTMLNNYIYLYATIFDNNDIYNTLEMTVKINALKNYMNLHTYDDNDLNRIGKVFQKEINCISYDFYSVDKYKYFHANYYNSNQDYYVEQYITIINGHTYNIVEQKKRPISLEELDFIKKIIDSTHFEIDSYYENKVVNKSVNIFKNSIFNLIFTLACGFLLSLLIKFFKKTKKKNKEKE